MGIPRGGQVGRREAGLGSILVQHPSPIPWGSNSQYYKLPNFIDLF